MSQAKRMVTGFNHNIKHRGKLYHVQTEDSGLDSPHVITHLFAGGTILASRKTSYADIVAAENIEPVVKELMEEQHKEMLRNLVSGVYDDAEDALSGRTRSAQSVPPAMPPPSGAAPAAVGSVPASARPPEAVAARSEPERKDGEAGTLFGEDLVNDKSLDEVILSYLAEDTGNEG